jgi:outer membrane protein insertion porin family
VLHVREGVRFTVGAIRFEGLTVVSEDELTQYLLRPTHEKLNSTSRNPPAVEADLRTGAELVQRDLQGQGYLDASVSAPVFVPHPESATEDVILRVKQGRRFVFGEIQISGELLGLDKEVDKKIKDLPRQPFNEVKAEQAKKEIVGLYQGRGHFGAVVDWKADAARHADGTIPVRFRITPGPLYHIARIDIAPGFSKGAQRLARAKFIPRRTWR